MCNGNTNTPEEFYEYLECRPDYTPAFDYSDNSHTVLGKELFLQKWVGKSINDVVKIIGEPHSKTPGAHTWLLLDQETKSVCALVISSSTGKVGEWQYFQTNMMCDKYFKPLYRKVHSGKKLKIIFPETGL